MKTLARAIFAALMVLLPGQAMAVDPEITVGGVGSKWFTGSVIQQTGLNCSTAILGQPYTEVMVSGYASYGGQSGPVRVGQGYYASFLVAVPGFPCGTSVSGIATDVLLPDNTTIDTSRPIRCFGRPNLASDFGELTGGQWNYLGSTGDFCPTAATPSAYVTGGWSVGYRPVGNGQMFQVFLPVKTMSPLVGAAASPVDAFFWATNATGVYANPGLSTVWTNVFPSSNVGQGPFVYFAREPAAQPYWKADAPATPVDQRNRVEFWANFFTAGQGGAVSYSIKRTDTNAVLWTSASDAGFNGTVAPGQDLVQILPGAGAAGPNGGYAPVAFDAPGTPGNLPGEWNVPMRVTWTFTPASGPPVSASTDFRSLAGPDGDGDGVADAADACPTVKGTLANGCVPPVETDADKDGIFGPADKCPTLDGKGRLDGCPLVIPTTPVIVPTPVVSPPLTPTVPLVGSIGTKAGTRFAATALGEGAAVPVTCNRGGRATVTLRINGKVAKALKLKSGVIAAKTAPCTSTTTLRLVTSKAIRLALKKVKHPVAGTLSLTLVGTTGGSTTTTRAVKVG